MAAAPGAGPTGDGRPLAPPRLAALLATEVALQQYHRRGPARPPGQSWRTFLRNHRPAICAADLSTVQTAALKPLYVLLVVAHGRRELLHLNVTASPTAAGVWRQLIEATPQGQ